MRRLKKIISIIVVALFLFARAVPVLGYEVPEAPSAPSAPTSPSVPEAPSAPTLEEALSPETTQAEETESPSPEAQAPESSSETNETEPSVTQTPDSQPTLTPTETSQALPVGQEGEAEIITGDATNTANLFTQANTNTNISSDEESSGANSENSGNGSDSQNQSLISLESESSNFQENSSEMGNLLELSTETGSNSASQNLGDSEIFSGDANTGATVITAANTNIDGVAMAEFNVTDDHVGDIVLDFESAAPVSYNDANTFNQGNGAGSVNEAQIATFEQDASFQENNADLENNLYLSSDSGNNNTSLNTGGDSEINTGDANVAANVVSFLNNNIAGNVVLGVVNIFGNLVGDIILPEGAFESASLASSAQNTGNGSGSENEVKLNSSSNSETSQANQAEIENNLKLKANTGSNEAARNTGGETEVITGDANIETRTVNVANSNIECGNLWLVIINEAGNWIGRIVGTSGNANVAGSEEMDITVDEKGNVSVQNSDNGAGSNNNSEVASEENSQTEQKNEAKIVNNLNLEANTGGNKANDNTGGDSTIRTGDANIIANIINFVNNNISSNGKILVTVINVFGDWVGNFLPPGAGPEGGEEPVGGQDNEDEVAEEENSEETETNEDYDYDYSWNWEDYYLNEERAEEVSYYRENAYLGYQSSGKVAGSSNQTEEESNEDDSFLSVEAITDNSVPKNKIKVNLAWLTLTLPLLGLTVLVRRLMRR